MRKFLLLLFISLARLTAFTQVDTVSMHEDSTWAHPEYKEASSESQAYHEYRLKITKPPYSLQKILNLVSKIRPEDEDEIARLPEKTYNALSFREKFTYNMVHEEAYHQICDPEMPIQDEHKKIFAELAVDMGGETATEWSEKQWEFFRNNRDSVIKLMNEGITRSKRVGLNFKEVIVEIKAKEMIPLLITTYNISKKDGDILTVLMLLMKDYKYESFLKSSSFKKLYGEDSDYRSFISYNKANEELIIKRATDFYNASK